MINRNINKAGLKELLSEKSKTVKVNELSVDDFGRISVEINSTIFETFLFPPINREKKDSKLYVFLSAVGTKNTPYPAFHRVTWAKYFDVVCIYIDDPTRNEKKFSPSYFFGSVECNYCDYIIQLIERLRVLYNIPYSDVCLISSSNGGTASIYIANKLNGIKCIAYNPQISVEKFDRAKKLNIEKGISVTYTDERVKDRLCVTDFIDKCSDSKFFIFFNTRCSFDEEQVKFLEEICNIKRNKHLVAIRRNVYLLAVDVGLQTNPHLAQPDEFFTQFIDGIMDLPFSKAHSSLCDLFVGEMRLNNKLRDELVKATDELKKSK